MQHQLGFPQGPEWGRGAGLELGVGCNVQGNPTVSFYPADVSGIDWMVRHGRSLALSVAVNVAPSRLCAGKYSSEVQDMILSNAVADRVRLCGSPTSPAPPVPQPVPRGQSLTQLGGDQTGWSEAWGLALSLSVTRTSTCSSWASVSSSKQRGVWVGASRIPF